MSTISSADDGVEDQFLDTNGDVEEEDSSAASSESKEVQYRIFIEGLEPNKQDVDVLNVIEKRAIDQGKFPHVHEWRKAMLKMSVEERDR